MCMQMGAVFAFTLKKKYVKNNLHSFPTLEMFDCLEASILHLIHTVQTAQIQGLLWWVVLKAVNVPVLYNIQILRWK